jgi:hypothetical protein
MAPTQSESGFMVDALKTALDIHMTVTGAYERADDSQKKDICALKAHLAQWHEPTSKFDAACKQVMFLALKEAEV